MRLIQLVLLSCVLCLASCNKEEGCIEPQSETKGSWRLIETMMDLGDGSGTFQSVNSSKWITIESDGTVLSNSELCEMDLFPNGNNVHTGSLNTSESTISVSCEPLRYEFDGDYLIIFYPCFCGCAEKYQRS